MRIIINGLPEGLTYQEAGAFLVSTMQPGRPVAPGEFSRIAEDGKSDTTITVTEDSDPEPGSSFLPWRVGKSGHTGAAFATKEQALAFLGVLLTPPFDESEELAIWFSLEVV